MGMALKADIEQKCRRNGTGQPIDLVFLSSRTMGDRDLEREILSIFESQLPQYVETIENSENDDALYKASHTLKGAAQSVGAAFLAEIAGKVEAGDRSLFAELNKEAVRVRSYIRELEG